MATSWLTVERNVVNAPLELAGVTINMPCLERTVGYVRVRVLAGRLKVRLNYVPAGLENRSKSLYTRLTAVTWGNTAKTLAGSLPSVGGVRVLSFCLSYGSFLLKRG